MKNWKKKLKKLLVKEQTPVDELSLVSCENCEYEFKGHYCPNCGQEVAEFNRPFGFVFYDFMGNFFAFDTRFLKTFGNLLFRPGKLTKEFFKGRRVSYSPPFRIFVFLSFVLFLLLQIISNKGLDVTLDASLNDLDKTAKLDSSLVLVNDSLIQQAQLELDSVVFNGEKMDLDFSEIGSKSLRENIYMLGEHFKKDLETTTDPQERKKLMTYIGMCQTPEVFVSRILKYLSWAFFILLPLFALLLKLVYIRHKQFYMRHLIFSIHLHSFLFFMLIIVITLNMIFTSGMGMITTLLVFSFPVYFILALKNFYGQGYGKVFLKFTTISFLYNIILITTVTLVFINALGLN